MDLLQVLRRKELIALLLAALWVFAAAACGPTTPIPPATEINSAHTPDLSTQISELASQTQNAASTTTALPSPTISLPTAPSSQQPSQNIASGPFVQVSPAEALYAGRVLELIPEAEGSAWLLSEQGYSRYQNGVWTGYLTDFMGTMVGKDVNGDIWVASRDGAQISAWNGEYWTTYSAEQGWTPVNSLTSQPVQYGIHSDGWSQLWLATPRDLRRFDGEHWQIFTLNDLGMNAPQGVGAVVTYKLEWVESLNELWVGSCYWGNAIPGGGGVRRFNGQEWLLVNEQLNTGCVNALQSHDQTVWVGDNASLWRYENGGWISTSPLPPPASGQFGYFAGLTIAPDGSPWPELSACENEVCAGGEALFHLQADSWQSIGELEAVLGRKLLFDPYGGVWLTAAGKIYRINDGQPQLAADLLVIVAAAAPDGSILLLAQASGPPTLWKLPQ